MKKEKRKSSHQLIFSFSVLVCLFFSLKASAMPLNLAQTPLFLGNTSIPNVLLMMDDSGSMDWEILTRRHWHICAYKNYGGSDGSGDCSTEITSTGDIRDYTGSDFDSFYYLFDNPTNLYDGSLWFTYADYESDWQGTGALFTALTSATEAQDWEESVDWRAFSSELNTVYFDPETTYSPWEGYNAASFTAAYESPDETGQTRNLTNAIFIIAEDDKGFTSSDGRPGRGVNLNYETSANGMIDIWDTHTIYNIASDRVYRYQVTYSPTANASGTQMNPTWSDLGAITDTTQVAEIKQNYANWYQYYRRRFFHLKASLSSLIDASPNYRYMLGAINENDILVNAPSDNNALSSHNQSLVASMFSHAPGVQGTPLRKGLYQAGNYFMSTQSDAPIEDSCQLNFSILMTDGFWNGAFSPTSPSIGDEDVDGNSPTLADVAHYFYNTDLRADLENNVLANAFDTMTSQHMNTLVLSFGLSGNLTDSDNNGWPDSGGTDLAENSGLWGDPTLATNYDEKVNDLWHAALNSRGAYFDVTSSSSLLESLRSALATVDDRSGSAAALTLNRGSIQSGSSVYQGSFDSSDWSGDLLAYGIDSDTGDVNRTATWSASTQMDSKTAAERTIIFSYQGSGSDTYNGAAFLHANLDTDWLTSLKTVAWSGTGISDVTTYEQAIVNYLRGDNTYEGAGFRTRGSKLGDIVHSSPVYVASPSESVSPYSEDAAYTTFKSTYSSRAPIIYVGANDGMLHAINAETGDETLAYIASGVKDNLYKLADPDYSHQFFFDASPVIKDVYSEPSSGSDSWITMLVTGFRAGGKGLAAIDITDPASFSEVNASNIVLWEYLPEDRTGSADSHETTHPDMGHIYGKPLIAKLNTGKWAVITGNGYNSVENDGASGKAVLFVLDVASGKPVSIIETARGSTSSPNGLSEPVGVDTDNNGTVDFVYAGDFQGNVWKFDLTSSTVSEWKIANDDSSNSAIPLFSAGTTQPVTAGLTVGRHPSGSGRIIYFGTGRYLTSEDHASTGQYSQAFYGIWDRDDADDDFNISISTASLLQQEVSFQTTFTVAQQNSNGDAESSGVTVTARETTNNSIDWDTHKGWYLTLEDNNGNNNGERVLEKPQLRNGRIIFNTLLPSSESCQTGGSSWLMELDAKSGSRLTTTSIDINQDGKFDAYDYSYASGSTLTCSTTTCVPPSGIFYNEIISAPAILSDIGKDIKYIGGSSGGISKINENAGSERLGRQAWRQILLEDDTQ